MTPQLKILLRCPECESILSERFSAEFCKISVGGDTLLELECLNCGEDFSMLVRIEEAKAEGPER